MLYQVESMFDDMEKKMRRLKKQKYEENMENFMAANEAYFLEMEAYLDKGDPETAAKEIAEVFVEAVKSRYGTAKSFSPLMPYGMGGVFVRHNNIM